MSPRITDDDFIEATHPMGFDPMRMFYDTAGSLKRALTSNEAHMVMTELYETKLGIYNHAAQDKARPLADVAKHPSEETDRDGVFEASLKSYAMLRIKDLFGLSYLDWISLPHNRLVTFRRVATELNEKHSKMVKEIDDGLENNAKKR